MGDVTDDTAVLVQPYRQKLERLVGLVGRVGLELGLGLVLGLGLGLVSMVTCVRCGPMW